MTEGEQAIVDALAAIAAREDAAFVLQVHTYYLLGGCFLVGLVLLICVVAQFVAAAGNAGGYGS